MIPLTFPPLMETPKMQDENSIRVYAILSHQGHIFFFDSNKEREQYIHWLLVQPKEQWNIATTINRVGEDSPHFDKACTWHFSREIAKASLDE